MTKYFPKYFWIFGSDLSKIVFCIDISLTNIFCFHSTFPHFPFAYRICCGVYMFSCADCFCHIRGQSIVVDCMFFCGIYLLAVCILSSQGRRKSILQRERESGWERARRSARARGRERAQSSLITGVWTWIAGWFPAQSACGFYRVPDMQFPLTQPLRIPPLVCHSLLRSTHAHGCIHTHTHTHINTHIVDAYNT